MNPCGKASFCKPIFHEATTTNECMDNRTTATPNGAVVGSDMIHTNQKSYKVTVSAARHHQQRKELPASAAEQEENSYGDINITRYKLNSQPSARSLSTRDCSHLLLKPF